LLKNIFLKFKFFRGRGKGLNFPYFIFFAPPPPELRTSATLQLLILCIKNQIKKLLL
jgi:hypothetical protein